jgi:hypothetical protein
LLRPVAAPSCRSLSSHAHETSIQSHPSSSSTRWYPQPPRLLQHEVQRLNHTLQHAGEGDVEGQPVGAEEAPSGKSSRWPEGVSGTSIQPRKWRIMTSETSSASVSPPRKHVTGLGNHEHVVRRVFDKQKNPDRIVVAFFSEYLNFGHTTSGRSSALKTEGTLSHIDGIKHACA